MTYLLTADWHLDDNPANEYRWQVFDRVRDACDKYPISTIFVLGDLVDRKDRHSALLVNRLVREIRELPIVVLRGNHDTTLKPPCYFEWLEGYVSKPRGWGRRSRQDWLLLLPFTPNPSEEWRDLRFEDYRAVFMHQTVSGAVIDRGIVLDNPNFPPVPQHIPFYSGDIHHPQIVGNVTYVGAPHHVKFGDDYHCRMLLLDEQSFTIVKTIPLSPPSKLMIDITSLADLANRTARPGDQVKIRLNCSPSALDGLAGAEAEIAEWARTHGVTIAATEIIVNAPVSSGVDTSQTPEAILRQFAEHERLSAEVLAVGLDLLQEAGDR